MKILFLYPVMPNNITNCKETVRLAGRKSIFPPIGLLTVAALLPKNWEKKVTDLNTDELNIKDLLWADYVFIGAMNVQAKSVFEILEICKLHKVKVVAGGPLFTHEYQYFEGVEHFVLNEAEITLPQFLKDLENGNPQKIYQTNEFANVEETPVPLWELVDLNKYLNSIVQYSRGCPYLCDFCDVTALFGRRPRTKTPTQIINELNIITAYGNCESILFADDNLIGNKNILKKELLPALIEWRRQNPYAPGFTTQLTINLADDEELCYLLLEAGFRHVLIGIESIEDYSLIAMKKKQNAGRNVLETIKYLHSIGFIITGTFIVGLDTDKPTVFDDVIKFIKESGIVYVIVNILKAPPGTELYERMIRENRLLNKFEFDEDKTNIIPIMDTKVLEEGFKKVITEVYSSENIIKRVMTYYKDKNNLYKVKYPIKRKPRAADIKNFIKIIIKLGLIDKKRKYFWQLIFITIIYNYKFLDHSMFYASLMYQYEVLLKIFLQKENKGETIYSSKLSA